ncbi:SxtJ family membrane protein [Pelagibacteraceae bacterium]|nr:SxtJ family membrane protein [Pelagibacteraceae bacterium]
MKKTSVKSFGILFSIVFLFIALWPLQVGQSIKVWSIVLSVIFLTLGLINSKLLIPLNNSWIKLGEILGKIIAPIIMALIYFTVLTPISLIIRIFGKDLLKTKFSKKDSYWIKREKNIGSMKRQF